MRPSAATGFARTTTINYAVNEPQGQLLGQRLLGDAVQFAEGGEAGWATLSDDPRGQE